MKKITFLLFTIYSCSIFGQDKLTSSLNEIYNGTTWERSSKTTYEYNSNKDLTSETYHSWDSNTSTWKLNSKESFAYNNANKIISETYENYDFSSGAVTQSYKTTYSYNSNNQISTSTSQELENGVWVNEDRNIFSYTNNKITGFVSEKWNGTSWAYVISGNNNDPSIRGVVNYGTNGFISENIYEEWNGTSWDLDARELYSYDVNNNLVENQSEDWTGTAYVNDYKIEYTYDANGNLILEKDFGFSNGVFTSDYEISYIFDTSAMLSNFIHPFRDRTGFSALTGQNNQFVNKILSSSSSENDRTTYNYNGATASVNEFDTINFSVYPNPTSSIVKIDDTSFTLKNVEAYNIIGKKVFTSFKNEINLEELVNGVYVLKVQSKNGKIATKRIIKN